MMALHVSSPGHVSRITCFSKQEANILNAHLQFLWLHTYEYGLWGDDLCLHFIFSEVDIQLSINGVMSSLQAWMDLGLFGTGFALPTLPNVGASSAWNTWRWILFLRVFGLHWRCGFQLRMHVYVSVRCKFLEKILEYFSAVGRFEIYRFPPRSSLGAGSVFINPHTDVLTVWSPRSRQVSCKSVYVAIFSY